MSEDKDKMHLAELEQDVLGEPLTHLEESAMQNTIKLTIENKRLRARIKELEEEAKKCRILCANCHQVKTAKDTKRVFYQICRERKIEDFINECGR